jgi:hypothetical protein
MAKNKFEVAGSAIFKNGKKLTTKQVFDVLTEQQDRLKSYDNAARPENQCPKCKTPNLEMFDSDNNQCTRCKEIVSVC